MLGCGDIDHDGPGSRVLAADSRQDGVFEIRDL